MTMVHPDDEMMQVEHMALLNLMDAAEAERVLDPISQANT